jgi:hypothetical protein
LIGSHSPPLIALSYTSISEPNEHCCSYTITHVSGYMLPLREHHVRRSNSRAAELPQCRRLPRDRVVTCATCRESSQLYESGTRAHTEADRNGVRARLTWMLGPAPLLRVFVWLGGLHDQRTFALSSLAARFRISICRAKLGVENACIRCW